MGLSPLDGWNKPMLIVDWQVSGSALQLVLCRQQGRKGGYPETEESGRFWRATMIDIDTRLRVARRMGKTEPEAAIEVLDEAERRDITLEMTYRECPSAVVAID